MAALLDVIPRLPRRVSYEADPLAHDQRFRDRALAPLDAGMLLLFDLGFLIFTRLDALTNTGVWFLTRKEERTVTSTQQVLRKADTLRDQIVRMSCWST